MSKTIIERQDLVEVVNALPDEVLVELANFLDYLRYKTSQDKKNRSWSTKLFALCCRLR